MYGKRGRDDVRERVRETSTSYNKKVPFFEICLSLMLHTLRVGLHRWLRMANGDGRPPSQSHSLGAHRPMVAHHSHPPMACHHSIRTTIDHSHLAMVCGCLCKFKNRPTSAVTNSLLYTETFLRTLSSPVKMVCRANCPCHWR